MGGGGRGDWSSLARAGGAVVPRLRNILPRAGLPFDAVLGWAGHGTLQCVAQGVVTKQC
jgi:hypothetical protein